MQTIHENLTQYAAYHRDRRNVATHFVGVPLIVFAIVLALTTVMLAPGAGVAITAAVVVSAAACAYYVWMDIGLGIVMSATLLAMCAGASRIAVELGTAGALAAAVATFVVGWIIQFVGHRFEGVKPAFFDDARQLLIGPLFVAAEICFLLGARADLRRYIEDRVGPTVPRREGRAIPIVEEANFD